jgi:hypothetical protein
LSRSVSGFGQMFATAHYRKSVETRTKATTMAVETRKPRGPIFKVGDVIRVAAPGVHTGKTGVLVEVIDPKAGDYVYRYKARFLDSSAATFFGFELELSETHARPKK